MPSTGQIILPQYNSGGNWDEKLITPESGKVLGFDVSLNPVQLSKQDALVSGSNIKTINGSSILGPGDIIGGGTRHTPGNTLVSTRIANASPGSFGNYAVDLQVLRNNSTEIAAGEMATIPGGALNTATGAQTFVCQLRNTATAILGVAFGTDGLANKSGEFVIGAKKFETLGDSQSGLVHWRHTTTTASFVEALLTESGSFTLENYSAYILQIQFVGQNLGGTKLFAGERKLLIRRQNGAGTTSLVGAVQTIGTDHSISSSAVIQFTADAVNGKLKCEIHSGEAVSYRWTITGYYTKILY